MFELTEISDTNLTNVAKGCKLSTAFNMADSVSCSTNNYVQEMACTGVDNVPKSFRPRTQLGVLTALPRHLAGEKSAHCHSQEPLYRLGCSGLGPPCLHPRK